MAKNEEELKNFLKEIKREDIIFKPHFYDKQKEDRQYLSEELIVNSIKDVRMFSGFQNQSTEKIEKYRIAIRMSGRYTLVVVCEIKEYLLSSYENS